MTTRFLIDEDVNQKVIRSIPRAGKGFDILYPQQANLKGAVDSFVEKRVQSEGRVLVTYDKDFLRSGLTSNRLEHGVLLISPRRQDRKAVSEILQRFCTFLLKKFSTDPYNFAGRLFHLHENDVEIIDEHGKVEPYSLLDEP
jgi:predicted nuclease of predicted toxin-antitoxin system